MQHSDSDRAIKALAERFGRVAEGLADALHMMSLSLVKIVLGYLAFPPARANTKPTFLFETGTKQEGRVAGGLHGVACSPFDETFWICCANRVSVFSADGKFLHAPKLPLGQAVSLAIADDGCCFIADKDQSRIVVCRADGSFSREFHTVQEPMYIAAHKNQLFVTERRGVRALSMLDGTVVKEISGLGRIKGQVNNPRGIAVNQLGEIGVADAGNFRVQVFDCSGALLRKFSEDPRNRFRLRKGGIYGLAADAACQWVAVNYDHNCVDVYSRAGVPLTSFGEMGQSTGQFFGPMAVAVDSSGRIVVVDFSFRVHVFGFE